MPLYVGREGAYVSVDTIRIENTYLPYSYWALCVFSSVKYIRIPTIPDKRLDKRSDLKTEKKTSKCNYRLVNIIRILVCACARVRRDIMSNSAGSI